MDREKPIRKKIRSKKSKKTLKIKVKLPHVNKKTTSEKADFCSNTVLSLYFKIRRKVPATKPLASSLHFLFRRDQNHHSNLALKIIKMCEQIFKKHSRTNPGQQIQEISLAKQKTQTRPRTNYEWIGNTT